MQPKSLTVGLLLVPLCEFNVVFCDDSSFIKLSKNPVYMVEVNTLT